MNKLTVMAVPSASVYDGDKSSKQRQRMLRMGNGNYVFEAEGGNLSESAYSSLSSYYDYDEDGYGGYVGLVDLEDGTGRCGERGFIRNYE